ncbi:TPA: hypothetical protein ACH3X1_014941 [Trebouxia sp. C0004]
MTTIGSVTFFGPAHSNRCDAVQLKWAFQRGLKQPQALITAGSTRSFCSVRRHVSTLRLQARHAAAAGQLAQEVSPQDRQHMQHALSLAKKALGKTFPNPAVGCVIVKQGKVIGEGYHPKAGEPHAEVFALRAAGQQAAGATAYVTLEPCNHYGKTPPCSQALVDAKVAKVSLHTSTSSSDYSSAQHICIIQQLLS